MLLLLLLLLLLPQLLLLPRLLPMPLLLLQELFKKENYLLLALLLPLTLLLPMPLTLLLQSLSRRRGRNGDTWGQEVKGILSCDFIFDSILVGKASSYGSAPPATWLLQCSFPAPY